MAIDLSKYGQPVSPKATGIDLSKYGQPVQLTPEERKRTDGFFTSVYKSIAAPVANILARPVQLGQELTGNKQFEGTFLGLDIEKPENYRDVLKDVGRGIQTVALGIGAPGTVGAVKTGLTQGLKQGIKEGAILGLKTSPLFGAGVSLEQGNTNIGTILKDAAEATAFGVPTTAAFGTIAPLAKAGIGKFTKQGLRDELGNIYRTTASKYVKPRAILDQADLVHQTDPISVLQMYGKNVIPEMQNGSALTKEGQAFLKQKIAELGNIKSEALFLSDERVPLQGFRQYANELVDAMKMSESKKTAIRAEVNAIIDELDAGYQGSPKNVNGLELTEIDLIKSEQTALSKAYNNKKPRFEYDSHGVVGKAARDLVELLTDSSEVKELNKLIQSHYDAIDFLQSINGKKVHGGALSKSFLKLGGDIIGATAGQTVGQPLIGAVTGHVISGKIADIVQNKFISNPVKRALINKLKEQAPKEVTNVVRSMEAKYGDIFKDIFPGGAVYKKGGSYGGLTQQELEKIAGQSSPSNMETLSTKTNTANAITNTIPKVNNTSTNKASSIIPKVEKDILNEINKYENVDDFINSWLRKSTDMSDPVNETKRLSFINYLEKISKPSQGWVDVVTEIENKAKSKGVINKAKEFFNPDLPNKQGGFVRIGKELPKAKNLNPTEIGSLTRKELETGKSNSLGKLDDLRLTKQDTGTLQDALTPIKNGGSKYNDFTVYRVVPKGKNIGAGDFVFDNKKMAEDYLAKYGKSRGLSEIKTLNNVKAEDLLVAGRKNQYGEMIATKGELIYAPKSTQSLPKSKVNESVSSLNDTTLLKEAKKYKSAEEFVKAKQNALHGSDVEIKEFSKDFLGKNTESKATKDTFFFTSSKEMADEYGRAAFLKKKVGELGSIKPEQRAGLLAEAKGKAILNEVSLDYKNPKIIKQRGLLREKQVAKDIEKAKAQGYDAVVYKDVIDPVLGDSEKFIRGDITAIFDQKQIKTKSQLEQIWKQANKSPLQNNKQAGFVNLGVDEFAQSIKNASGEKILVGTLAGAFSLAQFNKLLSDQMTRIEEKAYREGLSQVQEIPVTEIKLQSYVPEKYKSVVVEATKGLRVRPEEVAALIQTENSAWDEEFVNPQGTDTGLGQHNADTYKDINKLYKKKYGKSYDRKNGEENIKATALWLDHLLTREGINGIDDAIKAYRIGVEGLRRVREGRGTAKFTEAELRSMANDKLASYKQALQG